MDKKFIAEGDIEVTDDLLDQLAEPWERGRVPGVAAGFVAAPGRPRLSEEDTQIVALRLPVSIVRALDVKAKEQGETRSQLMRDAVLANLMSS
jgi:hypothetical protein